MASGYYNRFDFVSEQHNSIIHNKAVLMSFIKGQNKPHAALPTPLRSLMLLSSLALIVLLRIYFCILPKNSLMFLMLEAKYSIDP